MTPSLAMMETEMKEGDIISIDSQELFALDIIENFREEDHMNLYDLTKSTMVGSSQNGHYYDPGICSTHFNTAAVLKCDDGSLRSSGKYYEDGFTYIPNTVPCQSQIEKDILGDDLRFLQSEIGPNRIVTMQCDAIVDFSLVTHQHYHSDSCHAVERQTFLF